LLPYSDRYLTRPPGFAGLLNADSGPVENGLLEKDRLSFIVVRILATIVIDWL